MTFEKGVGIVFKWIAMFSTIGEWCVILVRELLKTFLKGVSKQKLTIIQLETCLALPFHSDLIGEEGSPQDPCDDFPILRISPDTFESWISACESAAGISEENIPPIEVALLQVDVVMENIVHTPPSDSNGLLPPPERLQRTYTPSSREIPVPKKWSRGEGFGSS